MHEKVKKSGLIAEVLKVKYSVRLPIMKGLGGSPSQEIGFWDVDDAGKRRFISDPKRKLLPRIEKFVTEFGEENLPSRTELYKLELASKKLLDRLLDKHGGQLPEFIIYPETSARVLPYLFNPVFRLIAERNQQATPINYYMATYRDTMGEKEKEEKFNQIHAERAREILENIRLRSKDGGYPKKITVIDETMLGGRTRETIEESFHGINPDLAVDFYALLGDDSSSAALKPERRKRVPEDWSSERDGEWSHDTFWKNHPEKYEMIGVEKWKEEKYVEKSELASYQHMKKLRDILGVIGEDLAEHYRAASKE